MAKIEFCIWLPKNGLHCLRADEWTNTTDCTAELTFEFLWVVIRYCAPIAAQDSIRKCLDHCCPHLFCSWIKEMSRFRKRVVVFVEQVKNTRCPPGKQRRLV